MYLPGSPTAKAISRPPALQRRELLLAAMALGAAGRVAAADTLRYVGDRSFAPFEFLDEQGRPQGFQVELLNELGPLIGADFKIDLQPWATSEAQFREGKADLMAMVKTGERMAWAAFAHGHATPAIAVYRKKNADDPQDLDDLKGLRIAVPDAAPMRETLQTWLQQVPGPYLRFQKHEDVLGAVQAGQADVALLPRAYADPLLALGTAPDVVASSLVLKVQTYAFAVRPGETALQARLQDGLHQMERSGRLEALRLKWLSSHRDLADKGRLEQGLTEQKTWTWGIAGASGVALLALTALAVRRGRRLLSERERRRAAEAALSRAEHLLERSFTLNPEPMLIVHRGDAVVRDTNAALQTLLGVPARHIVGTSLNDLAQHLDAKALAQMVQSLSNDGALSAAPLRLTRADGQPRDCLVFADRMDIGGDEHVFCIVRDVTDQLAHDAELHRAYDQLADDLRQSHQALQAASDRQAGAERSLRDFTRAVAHDLRAPLVALHGFVGLLRERLQEGHVDEAQLYTDHIERAARRMNSMINALTGLAQVDRQPLQRQTVNMHRLAQDTWILLRGAQTPNPTELRLQDDLPMAQADPDLTAQVWQNLLHNALKYSAKVTEPKVAVTSFRDERGVWYRVTDNGAGFDMAKADLLFQPFQRMHSASQFEGSGVGLSLVRRIVEHHGGEIRLRSSPGIGTVAEFTLDPPPDKAVQVR